ncbi:cupin domain-containing protein [Sinorhizobium garamanticum]|uniref:Cupin domain-containing protein n=1 Tax=Sinorhizobium garamanticum TaxID=680247 RepID=A0ABY8DHF1_9HYPH|nr:cupin domain-containing protein [Sinorhizobium garamanticum]WEX90316.1 cupin domain-containing protein [Sinorhizobium garamanticum]
MHVDDLMFAENEGIPNNPHLPVLIYHAAVDVSGDGATRIEDRFHANGWRGVWRDGVFDFQHYHTRAHEVLAVARGKARLLIGGPAGKELEVMAGDVLLLPAGTGHCRIAASADFLVIGGYPPGQHADIQRGPATNADRQAIASVPLPQFDPVFGTDGPAVTLWQRATR